MVKFSIWGLGKRGKKLVHIIGHHKIEAIIDRDAERQNTEYMGITIVSPENYLANAAIFPLIVSPKGHQEEISELLKQNKVTCFFGMNEDYLCLLMLAPAFLDKVSAKCEQRDLMVIYGFNLLGLLLYEGFLERGYNCCLIHQDTLDDSMIRYMREALKINTTTWDRLGYGRKHLFLSEKSDIENSCNQRVTDVYKCYEMDLYYDLFRNPSLEKFRGIHKRKRCFIVATGPSLSIEDLNVLHQNGEICISVNGILKAFNKTEWRPDYYMISDLSGLILWKDDILSASVKEKFIADSAYWYLKEDEKADNVHEWHMRVTNLNQQHPAFSDDFAKVAFTGGTVIYDGALQLAIYMGFSEIYLLGTDCCNYSTPETQHFIEDYVDKNYSTTYGLTLERVFAGYRSAKEYADMHKIKIYNATRGGQLEIFERVDFDKLFDRTEKH